MADASVRYRVSTVQNALIKSTAVLFDVIGFILMLTVIGEMGTMVIGVMGDVLFLLWFWMLGANYMGGKSSSKLVTVLVNFVAENIPFINGFYPGFSVAAWRLISIMKKEDEEEAKKKNAEVAKSEAVRVQEQNRSLEIRLKQIRANENEAAAAQEAA